MGRGSRCREAHQFPLFTSSKLMGHTNIQTTEIYAKIVDKKKEEAINLIDGMFK
jgi:integrase